MCKTKLTKVQLNKNYHKPIRHYINMYGFFRNNLNIRNTYRNHTLLFIILYIMCQQ